MPHKIPSPCNAPLCNARTTNRYCPEHTGTDNRPSAARRGYDTQHRKLRAVVLAEEPLCRFCAAQNKITPATEADHIIDIVDRPELRLVRTNIRALCKPCHSRRTASAKHRLPPIRTHEDQF